MSLVEILDVFFSIQPYCRVVIAPKVTKFRKLYLEKLRCKTSLLTAVGAADAADCVFARSLDRGYNPTGYRLV